MAGRIRSRAGVVAIAAAVAASSGCWLQVGNGPGHTRANAFEGGLTTATVAGLHEEWAVPLPGTGSEAMVADGRVILSWNAGLSAGVRAVDETTGATVWDRTLMVVPAQSGALAAATSPTLVDGTVRTGAAGFLPITRTGPACVVQTYHLDPATGFGASIASAFPSPTAADGPVVARALLTFPDGCTASPSIVLDVDVAGGSPARWQAPVPGGPVGTFLPTIVGGRLFLAHGATVDAYAATGCGAATCPPVWSRTFDASVSTPMAEATGPLFVPSGGDLLAVDPATGADVWRAPLGGGTGGALATGMALAGGTVYVTTTDTSGATGTLLALPAGGCGAATCAPTWTATLAGAPRAPVVAGGVVYASS
ncbi:MAG TPA: PQQ-binding-like beta-propeller repeat protein, partial [Acidimicrobiales bacterium]